MGGRFVLTALIAMTLLSLVLTSVHGHLNPWLLKQWIGRFKSSLGMLRMGRSYTFGDSNVRRAVSTGHKGTGGNGWQ
uniref:Conotoxin n=1 Tax=Conus andremenezi TaxID=1077466 RepID=A0A291C218_9COND|nr:conotoxin [Conus andremenezi]